MATTSSRARDSATDLRRHVSYHWQLFVPLTVAMWVVVAGMGLWQRHNMEMINDARVREPLEFINSRIIDAYENELDPLPFINFMANYYKENPLYEKVCLSVYDRGNLVYNNGAIIQREVADENTGELVHVQDNDANFFYKAARTSDGRIEVYAMMPFDSEISVMLDEKSEDFWLIMLGIAVVLTVIGYYSTRHFGRNISMLRDFAEKAATSPDFVPSADYPHDELGDISRQIVHIYQERLQALERLKHEHEVAMHAMEEKARVKRQLTNNINHELKTPIGVIKGYLDTIVNTPDIDPEAAHHFIVKAQQHADRLAQLVADVTAISRLQDGSSLINVEALDYHDIVFGVGVDIEESGTLGNLTFENGVRPGVYVQGNYNLLSGMLMNLVRNAVAYSRGTVCGVHLTGEDEKFYHFEFFDNGVGVGDEHLEHLFERFYRIDAGRSRKVGGTGLGLPIVESTVEAHGGRISVRNADTGGLVFAYTLPKAPTPDNKQNES
ncbi:MAG: HAMP domain-containing histidine kinase [Muribaculaceae bacterium]|nr:HAMP domain-containing histidine kinase [Muribaculaceae bacterium]